MRRILPLAVCAIPLLACNLIQALTPPTPTSTPTARVLSAKPVESPTTTAIPSIEPTRVSIPTETIIPTPIPTAIGGASGRVFYLDKSGTNLFYRYRLQESFKLADLGSWATLDILNRPRVESLLVKGGEQARIAIFPSPDGSKLLIVVCILSAGNLCAKVENYTTNLDLSQINPIQPGEERIDWYWWSPDGTAIAGRVYDNRNCGVAYALVNSDGSGFQRFGNTRCEGSPPFWSPDSSKIYYSAEGRLTAVNRQDLMEQDIPLEGWPEEDALAIKCAQFSPNGSQVAFVESPDDSGSGDVRERLYIGSADFTSLKEIAEFSPTTPYCDAVKWSPDSQFAFTRFYECEESCKVEDYVFRIDSGEALPLAEQAYVCGWSPDARLVYLDNLLKMADPSDPGSTPLELPLIDCPLLWLP